MIKVSTEVSVKRKMRRQSSLWKPRIHTICSPRSDHTWRDVYIGIHNQTCNKFSDWWAMSTTQTAGTFGAYRNSIWQPQVDLKVDAISQTNWSTFKSITTSLVFKLEHGVVIDDLRRPLVSPLAEESPVQHTLNCHIMPVPKPMDDYAPFPEV